MLVINVIYEIVGSFYVEFEKGFGGIDINMRIIYFKVIF